MLFASILVAVVTTTTTIAITSSVYAVDLNRVELFNPINLPDTFKLQSDEWPGQDYSMTAGNFSVNFDENNQQDMIANRCYSDDSGTIVLCVYAANITVSVSSQEISPLNQADDFRDCYSNIKTIGGYEKCVDYRILEAYYSWFRLVCLFETLCINPDTCAYKVVEELLQYRAMPEYTTVPYVPFAQRTADLSYFIQKCKRTDLYRTMSDKYNCVNPPEKRICDLYEERLKPTTPKPTTPQPSTPKPTTPKPVDPENPATCADYADCRKAVGSESNLVPNYCDCHHFWQCQQLSVLEQNDPNQGWKVIAKSCPLRDVNQNLQYFDVNLKVCVNERNNSVPECVN